MWKAVLIVLYFSGLFTLFRWGRKKGKPECRNSGMADRRALRPDAGLWGSLTGNLYLWGTNKGTGTE